MTKFALALLIALIPWVAFGQDRDDAFAHEGLLPDGIYSPTRLENWTLEFADQARRANRTYCLELEGLVRLNETMQSCEARQAEWLGAFCGPQGQSLRNPDARSCLPEVESDLRWWLTALKFDLGLIRTAVPRNMAPPVPHSGPRTLPSSTAPARPQWAGGLDAMPTTLGPIERSARDIFAATRASIWVLHATAPHRGGVVMQGSAVAVSQRHLLTTCHVIEGMTGLSISQGATRHTVSVALADPASDRCVLATAQPVLLAVRGVRRRTAIEVGERVYTIAAPSGLELTLGEGVVSSLRQVGDVPTIQATALMSPGSSGGALLDARGNLIGVIAFQHRSSQSLSFAIAADSFWSLRP